MTEQHAENTFKTWIFRHSWGLLIAILVLSADLTLDSYRIDKLETAVQDNTEAIKTISITTRAGREDLRNMIANEVEEEIDALDKEQIREYTEILGEIKALTTAVIRIQDKLDTYDQSIQELYKRYELKEKNGGK